MISNPFGRKRRQTEERLAGLRSGVATVVEGRLRRTSARGWGPWTPVRITLGTLPDGAAVWHVEDPVAVGVPAVHGAVHASFASGATIWLRPVRFQTEGFWGTDAQIVVVEDDRSTIELALEPPLDQAVAERLTALLSIASR